MPRRHKIKITSDDDQTTADAEAQVNESSNPPGAAGTVAEGAAEACPPEAGEQAAAAFNLEEQLAEAQRRAEEINAKYLRAVADLANLRKRARQEQADATRSGAASILAEVLPVLDNFARALAAAQESNDAQALMAGVKMSYDQAHAALAREGVRPIAAAGKPFDPLYHDAVGRLETDEHPEGTVVVEVQKGYMLGDRVLRPSRVLVAARPRADPQDGSGQEQ